jgi:ketosteroid isomerase-like protein
MPDISVENTIRSVLTRIDAAWREKKFDGLEECFDDGAVIVGPNYAEYAVGGKACAESYRDFACNASVLDYSEREHKLHAWPDTAVYTFAWQMTYERENGPKLESGTDQLVLGRFGARWRVLFRYIYFAPAV